MTFQNEPKRYIVIVTPTALDHHRYLEPYEIADALVRGEPVKFGEHGYATVEVRPA